MPKSLFIAEKPSVAAEFAKVLGVTGAKRGGFMESEDSIVTWCVGHLVKLSYPEVYDPALKKWRFDTLPFIPDSFRYELIPDVKSQFDTVSSLMKRKDVDRIYVCTDSGREGEYIYRLVDMMSGVGDTKQKLRVWIDSQTEDEIRRGIREAKPDSAYDGLAASAFLRAKEDYLMGINFSRALTLKYGPQLARHTGQKYAVISAGRVMTCVLGMCVRREREIRDFKKQEFFRVTGQFRRQGDGEDAPFVSAEWKAVEGSAFFASPKLYKDSGFLKKEDAEAFIARLTPESEVLSAGRKKEKKNAPLLYNLAELQNDCSRIFKISPDETLKVAQELYEKKLTTYPRTDARVLSTAVAKEIQKNLNGLLFFESCRPFTEEVLGKGLYKGLEKTRYTDDKAVTDHYAIIPTGQGSGQAQRLSPLPAKVYELIVRRFLSIFYPPAVYEKISAEIGVKTKEGGAERFFASSRTLKEPGWLAVAGIPKEDAQGAGELLASLKKGMRLSGTYGLKPGETAPPKRYTTGSMILAMENAGDLIEDEELRSQIRGAGIGTSATRAEILSKLEKIKYLRSNKKTQVLTPTLYGEMVYDVTSASIRQLLNPELTASWEKGLSYVTDGSVSEEEYMQKLRAFVSGQTNRVKASSGSVIPEAYLESLKKYY